MAEKQELTVKKTALAGKGQARLNPDILKEMGVGKDDKIEVSKGGDSIKLKTHASQGIRSDEIRLNGEDMENIGAGAGEKVSVTKA